MGQTFLSPHAPKAHDRLKAQRAPTQRSCLERVGWVERSETHQIRAGKMMGFARAQPILRALTILSRSRASLSSSNCQDPAPSRARGIGVALAVNCASSPSADWTGRPRISLRLSGLRFMRSAKRAQRRVEQQSGKQDQPRVAVGFEQREAANGIGNIEAGDLPGEVRGKGEKAKPKDEAGPGG